MSLLKTLEGVLEGSIKSIFLEEAVEKVADERKAICTSCEWNTTQGKMVNASKCRACGCWLKLKTRVMHEQCGLAKLNKIGIVSYPLKWDAVLDEKDEDKMDEII